MKYLLLQNIVDITAQSIKFNCQEDEMERVKNLVLNGKIPLDQAPPEMERHPIMLIEKHCNRLIAERRAKVRATKHLLRLY